MRATSFDALVIGAGIVGAACARELTRAGLHTAICERTDCAGSGATAAGMGHIAVMDDSDAQFALTSLSQKLWHELSHELPLSAEYVRCGSLWVAADEQEFREVQRKHEYYMQRGIPVEILDPQQLAEAEPHLRRDLAGALRMSADAVCYSPCVAHFWVESVLKAGGEIFFNTDVTSISDDGVRTGNGGFLAAGVIVIATGTAATALIPGLEVYPRKGHLAITDRHPGFLRHQLIELGYLKSAHASTADSVAFNVQPRATGQVLIGSSRQFGVKDPVVELTMLQRMLSRAQEYMPELAALSIIRSWTGFRAATPDKLPLIGLCPGFRNVYLATGHEGLGISNSLATAALLTDQILDRPSPISRTPYEAARSSVLHV